MRRFGLLSPIALTFLSCPSNACANGFEAGARQLFMIWVVFPVVMCCAGLWPWAMCFSADRELRSSFQARLNGCSYLGPSPACTRAAILQEHVSALCHGFLLLTVRRPSFSCRNDRRIVRRLAGVPSSASHRAALRRQQVRPQHADPASDRPQ